VNWNNRPAPKWGAADDNWSYGSVQRVQMLNDNLAKTQTHTLATVTSAMNAAATQDLRNVRLLPVVAKLLEAAPSPSAHATAQLDALKAWAATGSSRLDRDLDGRIDAGGAPAIWDAFYPKLFDAVIDVKGLRPLIGRDAGTSSDFTDGGFWYVEKALRMLNGDPVKRKFNTRFCGTRAKCAAAVWKALDSVPDIMSSDATKERIAFRPGLLPTTIRFTNRPTGIQQVISFTGHRP
jgi:hypothetical protein